jgi:type I restriction enzyme S subunit
MAGEWRASTWGEEISLEYGKALRDYDKASGKFRVFGSNGPIGWTEKSLASGPGVILGRKGAYRGIEFSREPFFVIDTAYYVVPKTEFDMRWLYYAIKYHKLGEIDDGSPIPSTTRSAVYVRDVDVPSVAEQRAIAKVLGALDDKIELNRRMNTTLEAMARALFQSWFVDFDPVRAKLDGRQPAGLDTATAALFSDCFRESALGPLPHTWHAAHLEEIASVSSGKRPEGRCNVLSPECNIPLYGGGGRMGYVPSSLYEKPILLTGRVGTLGLIFRTAEASWPSDNTLIVEPQTGYFDFTYFVLKGLDLITLNRGSTQPLLTQADLRRQMIVVPNKEVVKAFAEVSESIFRQMVSNDTESRTLATLRDTLLPKLLSGEITVTLTS